MLPHLVAALVLSQLGAHASGMRAPLACDTIRPPNSAGGGQVYQVAPGDNGRVAWTDGRPTGRGAPPPMVFVRDGRGATHAVGRAGAGPGEFRSVAAMSWRGDTLWISDAALARMQAFTDNGKFLVGHPVTTRVGLTMRPGGTVIGVDAIYDRSLKMHQVGADPLVVVATRTSARTDTLLHVAPPELVGDVKTIPELMQKVLVRGSADGGFWCAIERHPVAGLSTSCVDATGRGYLHGTQTLPLRSTTDSAWSAAIAGMLRWSPEMKRTDVTDFFHRPATLPLAFDLLVNRNGDMWMLRTHPLEALQVWDRLGSDGRKLASITVAGRMQIRALDGAWYYAADTDPDDLQTLLRCSIP